MTQQNAADHNAKTERQENSNQSAPTQDNCFIITPIGAIDSDTFKKTTGLLEAVIEPVLKKLNFKALPAHYIASPGSIPKQILRHLVEDRLVIGNLTGLNPNVMYELAVRHAVKLPIVMMAEVGTELPFDVKDQRTIFYSDNYSGVEKCKYELEAAILHVLSPNYVAENPIYDAIEANQIMKTVEPTSNDSYILNKLDNLEGVLTELLNSNFSLKHMPYEDVQKRYGVKIAFKDVESKENGRASLIKYRNYGVISGRIKTGGSPNELFVLLDGGSPKSTEKLLNIISKLDGVDYAAPLIM